MAADLSLRRLNWGCGPERAPAWVNSDLLGYGQEHVGDIMLGLPWDDGYFRYAVANHSLQMLTYQQLPRAVGELARVLRPGGTLRVLSPDPIGAFHAWEAGHAAHFLVPDTLEASLDGKLCTYLTWASTNRQVFTAPWLCELLVRYGFTSAEPVPWGFTLSGHAPGIIDLDTRRHESFVVEATR